ncbi:hypothetical protein IMSHALPRED_002279 [Imshaugia aleurites]|uniref:Secreted protein n=1 Tax=Imshaugia aleurites TaxID=172621 RepID=A0A8H3F2R6_9LECA|nr:hypothetical protein IMSHALPRED_002279 [Imshaugia aleurites]
MHLLNTLLVVITGVATSAALVLDMHVAIEEPKDPKEVVALKPMPVESADFPSGFKDCGSYAANIIDIRLLGCVLDSPDPCLIPSETNITLEIDYSPYGSVGGVTYLLSSRNSSGELVLVNRTEAVTVDPDQTATASMPFSLPSSGLKTIKAQVLSDEMLACVEAYAIGLPPNPLTEATSHEPVTAFPAGSTSEEATVADEPAPVKPADGMLQRCFQVNSFLLAPDARDSPYDVATPN